MRFKRAFSFLLVVWALLDGSQAAKPYPVVLTLARLEQFGINPKLFVLTHLSHDGSLLVGREKVSEAAFKQKGFFYKLHLFRFGGKGFLRKETMLLPIRDVEQSGLDPRGENLVIMAREGAEFWRIHLPTRKVVRFHRHVPGQAGFQGEPLMSWTDGRFYVAGYFYDREGHARHVLARLDLNPVTANAPFQEIINVDALRQGLPGPATPWTYMPPDQGILLVHAKPVDPVILFLYRAGKVEELDRGLAYGGIAAAYNRVLYMVKRETGERESLLKDFALGKSWRIGEGSRYTSPFISSDGKAIAVTLLDFASRRMSMFYGKEEENFQIRPIPEIQSAAFGSFRFSGDGRHWAFLNENGISVGVLP